MKIIKNYSNIIFILLIFITPIFNGTVFINDELRILFWALILLTAVISKINENLNKQILIIALATAMLNFYMEQNYLKGLGVALVFYISADIFLYNLSTAIKSINVLLIINVIILSLQLVGISDVFYSHVNYANEAIQISIFDQNDIPAYYLPQFRPSGIFPAPTFISYFCILVCSLCLHHSKKNNKLMLALTGILYVLTGSTMGLLLSIIFLIWSVKNRAFFIVTFFYFTSLLIYSIKLKSFFKYNFSYTDILESTINRSMHESIFILNPYLVMILAIIFIPIAILAIFKYGYKNLIIMLPGYLLIFGPIMLHDFSTSLMAYLFFGFGFAMIKRWI